MKEFHEERDKLNYLEAVFPDRSRRYAIKDYLSLMGQDAQATTVQELESSTKQAYQQLADMKKEFEGVDHKYDAQVLARDAALLKKPFNPETEVDLRPELNYYNYDHQEVEEIFAYANKAEELNMYLEEYH